MAARIFIFSCGGGKWERRKVNPVLSSCLVVVFVPLLFSFMFCSAREDVRSNYIIYIMETRSIDSMPIKESPHFYISRTSIGLSALS